MFINGLRVLAFATSLLSVAAVSVTPRNDTLILFDPKLLADDAFTASQFSELYAKLTNELHYNVHTKSYADLSAKSDDAKFELDFANHRYANLVLLPTSLKKLPKLSAGKLLDFVNDASPELAQQANVFVVSSPKHVNDDFRAFLNELGIYPAPKNHRVVDHFNYVDVEASKHDLLRLPLVSGENLVANQHIVRDLDSILYEGSAALISNSPLLIPVVKASRTAYTANSKDAADVWALGSQANLVVAFQGAENNNRVVWLGSDALVGNEFLVAETSNSQLVTDLLRWCFQETGVIKLADASLTQTHPARDLKISDEVTYAITLALWNPATAAWEPFHTTDLQLEVIMLDPYYRVFLQEAEETASGVVYSRTFKLPDHHGIFKFLVDYKQAGLAFVRDEIVRPIRHLANDEFPRSWELTNAWVYISGAVTVVVAWFVFVVLMLYSDDGEKKVLVEESKKDI
ncbi:hypothetical protein BABINDRAFT_10158 [Babjeviella inositovora NRRL Y-12698]|uniref:Dolichyl-diphosphooligosaccharide--protein glycosyltransferase subunit WBP1 n=1 Tax=Babjeviella inositovora NRRL Y-12698 TaxID=984486 RepID=A0A1E3QIU3_9ASCO|nr:uncharacterized protein BABINDRAFT_10158 [Babjeviella inositovora NRRL Y-12698]ODQ77528.1 hypothetical protein BABINDRAFT_10158 [Babjeviella inositovora NRRL Y-12698]